MNFPIGSVGWIDLTVPDADTVRDFYTAVAGWKAEGFDMGGYQDYAMHAPESGNPAAGICWRRGSNADLPSGWLVYITVADLDASLAAVRDNGGMVLKDPGAAGPYGRFAIIQDPSGAACALHENARES